MENPIAEGFHLFRDFIHGDRRERFFTALFLATIMVILDLLLAAVIVPAFALLWVDIVQKFIRYLLSWILPEIVADLLMLPFWFVDLILANLSNFVICGELFLFQFHEKFFDRDGFIFVCHRYTALNSIERASLWFAQIIQSAFRAIVIEKGGSVMPTILLLFFTIIKMSIHIDNELSLQGQDPGGGWHGAVASVVGAIVVLDWGFLVWDGVVGPNPQGVLCYLFGPLIIAGTLSLLAVLGKMAPPIGGGDQTLHRHIHWMHCVAGFSVPGAQPIVILASFAVFLNYLQKYS